MAPRANNTVFVSAQLSKEEKRTLDEAAHDAGVTRNRFIRIWIASLRERPKKP